MVVGNNIVVPVVLWGQHAPTHCISAIWMTPDMRNIVTACNDAQLCVWDVSTDFEVISFHKHFRAVWLAYLVEPRHYTAISLVQFPLSAHGMAVVTKLDRVFFSGFLTLTGHPFHPRGEGFDA